MKHFGSLQNAKWIVACALLLNLFCGTKETPPVDQFIAGGDTLGLDHMAYLTPDKSSECEIVAFAALRHILAGKNENDSLATLFSADFHRQLRLHTHFEWSESAAHTLLGAALWLNSRLDPSTPARDLVSEIDSLFNAKVFDSEGQNVSFSFAEADISGDTLSVDDIGQMSRLYSAILGMDLSAARILAEFTYDSDSGEKAVSFDEEQVSRLILDRSFEETLQPPKPKDQSRSSGVERAEKTESRLQDDSQRALMFRTQNSIRDSIASHLPNLVVLYQQHIRRSDSRDGTVWVNFSVNSKGSTESVNISRSDIEDEDFLTPLREYLQTIKFKAVPDTIGLMTFEFPLEFKADL
ncbi:hypothetical protein CHISP_1073 [Chitinispirillum alkaliphilum]|nr:hypothetical protein CHISP_1073 [Chitinispirillum alkaliphilum]